MLKRMTTAALLSAALGAGAAGAQDYPTRPVEFIVPWAPGGGSDALMRIVANVGEEHLGQPIPVINMAGVSGTLGLVDAANRPADGYTIAQIHDGLLVASKTGLTDITWDSFEPIALMTSSPQYVVVQADSPWQSFEDFATYAQENPGEIRMGVTLGGVPHLHAAMIEEATGGAFSYVGYEGTGERVRAVVGGNLGAAITDVSSAQQFVENGDLRFLAVGASERNPAMPDVPTLKELGYDLELSTTRGIVVPKGTPQEQQDILEEAFRQTAEDPDFAAPIQNAGADVDFRGQEEYREYLETLDTTITRLVGQLEE